MGKGDKKSKKGKIAKGSYGVSRNRKAIREKIKRRLNHKPEETVAEGSAEAAKPKKVSRKKTEA